MASSEDYKAARRALSQHLHLHHHGATGSGRLENRLEEHATIHFLLDQRGLSAGHKHEMLGEGETLQEMAHRVLAEGDEQHGTTNTAGC